MFIFPIAVTLSLLLPWHCYLILLPYHYLSFLSRSLLVRSSYHCHLSLLLLYCSVYLLPTCTSILSIIPSLIPALLYQSRTDRAYSKRGSGAGEARATPRRTCWTDSRLSNSRRRGRGRCRRELCFSFASTQLCAELQSEPILFEKILVQFQYSYSASWHALW